MTQERRFTYAETGVDVGIEAKAARMLYEAAKETWHNRQDTLGEVAVPFDDFSGIRFVRIGGLPSGTVMYGNNDGVATKTEFAERANKYDTLAFDLMAMVCDDAVIRGAEPSLVKTVLTVNTLGSDESRLPYIQQLSKGYVAAANEAGVAVINGEIAQHNDRMGRMDRFSLDWNGDVTWFGHESRLITGKNVTPGDYLIGLEEKGLRSNGISLVRKALTTTYGEDWDAFVIKGQRLIDLALMQSQIYAKTIVDMTGGWSLERKAKASVHAVAHISGGGIPEKLGRALRPSGFGALIDNPFTPSDIMLHCQEIGVSDREAYGTWNMGQGMIIISPTYEDVITIARDHGKNAKVIGRVTEEPGITIHSKGIQQVVLQF